MNAIANTITEHLSPLVGLRLTIARRAADMRGFHFGPVRRIQRGTAGTYALHIQCPWRIEGPRGIITGRADLWKPAVRTRNFDWDAWDYEKGLNLQDKRVGRFMGGYDPATRSYVNTADRLRVESVRGEECGGAVIGLSGGYRVVLFPAGGRGEDWRLFDTRKRTPHFVVEGGKIL